MYTYIHTLISAHYTMINNETIEYMNSLAAFTCQKLSLDILVAMKIYKTNSLAV